VFPAQEHHVRHRINFRWDRKDEHQMPMRVVTTTRPIPEQELSLWQAQFKLMMVYKSVHQFSGLGKSSSPSFS
jgi:hypothetical protein